MAFFIPLISKQLEHRLLTNMPYFFFVKKQCTKHSAKLLFCYRTASSGTSGLRTGRKNTFESWSKLNTLWSCRTLKLDLLPSAQEWSVSSEKFWKLTLCHKIALPHLKWAWNSTKANKISLGFPVCYKSSTNKERNWVRQAYRNLHTFCSCTSTTPLQPSIETDIQDDKKSL